MYTVGLKRRFWFGYKRYLVKEHDWQNFRFILNLADGAQLHIPGFSAGALKVYSDFWTHLQLEKTEKAKARLEAFAEVQASQRRQGAVAQQPEPRVVDEPEPPPVPQDPLFDEAKRRAAARVSSILGSEGYSPGLPARPN